MIRSKSQQVIGYVVLILFLVGILLPFLWMLVTSFKPNTEVSAYPPTLLPTHWTFSHYQTAFGQFHFALFIRNSLIVSIVSTFLVLLLASMAGFSIARLPIRYKTPLLISLLVSSVCQEMQINSRLFI